MKKNIKVLAAVIAGISIATTMYTPAFAAENSNVIAKKYCTSFKQFTRK